MKEDPEFRTSLELSNNKARKGRCRSIGRKKHSAILLDYRGWIIEVDSNFPNRNYVVKEKSDKNLHHVAYCSTLESALNQIFNIMLLENVNRKHDYGAKFKDLCDVIVDTKNEFSDLLNVNLILRAEIKRGENETA